MGFLKPRLYVTAGCQTGLYNRFDNQLYTRETGLKTGLATGLTTGCIVYTNIYQVVKPV